MLREISAAAFCPSYQAPGPPLTACSGREEIGAIETKYLKDVLMEETGIFLNQFYEQTIKNQGRSEVDAFNKMCQMLVEITHET